MNAEQLARALGGKRSGRQYVAKCPAHADTNPSLLIFDGHDAVQLRCLAGCAPLDVIDALKARDLWSAPERSRNIDHNRNASPRLAQTSTDDREAEQHVELALRIWGEGLDPGGTLAEVYLWSRELLLPEKPGHVIRFHPACPRGRDRQPALVALLRDLESNIPRAVQRIFLTSDARKDGAQMLGPVGGCGMKLTDQRRTFWDTLGYCPRLHVCEGLETGLALLRDDYAPTWALGSSGALERMPVLFGIGELVICADNDESGTGLRAAQICQASWNATAHQHAVICAPDLTGKDFADDLGGDHDVAF